MRSVGALRDAEIIAAVLLLAAVAAVAYWYYSNVNAIDSGLKSALSNVPVISNTGSSDDSGDDSTGAALSWLAEWI